MADWGICATIKAPVEQVLAFVAHHLSLGARQIWLFLDDPDDPAFQALKGISGVTATVCDDAYWRDTCKTRPDTHQNRQSRNMRGVYNLAALPWIAHLDVDEFLLPSRPIGDILGDQPADKILLRMAPWEALSNPDLADDIFTANQFRAALKGAAHATARLLAFGRYAALLEDGVLSHAAGKCFFQSGFSGVQPRLHGAFRNGTRLQGGSFHQDIAVLHFHAEDANRWKQRLAFRLTKGAYQFNPALQKYLTDASPSDIDDFYTAVQRPDKATRDYLANEGLLIEAKLYLRNKVEGLLNRSPQ